MVHKTKEYWDKTKQSLLEIEPFSYDHTKELLVKDSLYLRYQGRAKNRTFIKENPKLYISVLYHTRKLEEIFKRKKAWKGQYSLSRRLEFIVKHDCDVEKLRCQCKATYNWTKYCRKCPEPKRNQLDKPHTEETKLKMRLSTLSYLENLKGQLAPRYNKDSIPLIEEYGKKNGYKFMHAENGGEFYVSELGYFLDAYDPIANVALEIDESHHFNKDGELIKRDVVRQKQIEEKLGCTFIRIKYDRI